MSIAIRQGQRYFKLGYSTEVNSPDESTLVLPAPTMRIAIDLMINNIQLRTTNYDNVVSQIATRFTKFWQMAKYDVAVEISDDSCSSFTIACKDTIFAQAPANAFPTTRTQHLTLSCLARDSSEIEFEQLMQAWDYLLVSWYVQMESRQPCIFSVAGRKFIELNLFWTRKFIEILQIEVGYEWGGLAQLADIVRTKYTVLQSCVEHRHGAGSRDMRERFEGKGVVGPYLLRLIETADD
ncbi:uncharacterized protein LODBEIA_P41160 [Lodderomyces beijingensis]|uniref:Uncharacterized protein n=1 Tax=Lodderomyces beijingensis TaxID=1775926 RepID=A0ABP0ZRB5_9ASCO